jgi:hypothetical protein
VASILLDGVLDKRRMGQELSIPDRYATVSEAGVDGSDSHCLSNSSKPIAIAILKIIARRISGTSLL